jgi:hypothetical protein
MTPATVSTLHILLHWRYFWISFPYYCWIHTRAGWTPPEHMKPPMPQALNCLAIVWFQTNYVHCYSLWTYEAKYKLHLSLLNVAYDRLFTLHGRIVLVLQHPRGSGNNSVCCRQELGRRRRARAGGGQEASHRSKIRVGLRAPSPARFCVTELRIRAEHREDRRRGRRREGRWGSNSSGALGGLISHGRGSGQQREGNL